MTSPLPTTTSSPPHSGAGFTLRFFRVCVAVYASVFALTWLLIRFLPGPTVVSGGKAVFPPAFLGTTLLLVVISVHLHRAVGFVRREKQQPFRQQMLFGLINGMLFIAVQGYGLSWLLRSQEHTHAAASTSANTFVFVLAFLHAVHITVALMFLTLVTLKSHYDRYDHEYYWGVALCGWFWHLLGIVWLAILAVISIAV